MALMDSKPLSIGGYRLDYLLARGDRARVYRAFQPAEEREIALKLIHLEPDVSENAQFLARFAAEAQHIAALEHLHIVALYDCGVDSETGSAFFAMRMMRGGTLADAIKAGRLSREQIARIVQQIAAALEYAHSRGVIHCDLKPSNILLDEHGNAYLADFGMAHLLNGSSLSVKGLNGTPAYLAPEQINAGMIDARTDVYCLGLIMYEMLTGKPAFSSYDGSIPTTLTKQFQHPPLPIRDLNHTVPTHVATVIDQAIRKAPAERYASVTALREGFMSAMEQWTQSTRQRSHHLALFVVFVGILAMLTGVIGTINESPYPRYFHESAIEWGTTGIPADAEPTEQEIKQAQAAFAGSGFIAYITCSTDNTATNASINEMAALASSYGIGYRMFNANRDVHMLVAQMQTAQLQGARALIVCALSAEIINTAIRAMADAGMPIVAFSSTPISGAVTVINDNHDTGQRLGEAAARYALTYYANPSALTAVVMTDRNSDIMAARAHGFIDGLLDGAELAAMRIIDAAVSSDEISAAAYIDNMLKRGTMPNFVLTPNDATTLGVIEALETAGIIPLSHDPATVNVFTVSTGTSAPTWLAEGRFVRGYVEINRRLTAETALHAIMKLMGGGSMPETLLVPAGELVIETQRRD